MEDHFDVEEFTEEELEEFLQVHFANMINYADDYNCSSRHCRRRKCCMNYDPEKQNVLCFSDRSDFHQAILKSAKMYFYIFFNDQKAPAPKNSADFLGWHLAVHAMIRLNTPPHDRLTKGFYRSFKQLRKALREHRKAFSDLSIPARAFR